jgi:hypothetical protein
MRTDRDLQIMLAMRRDGGSFVVALGEAWMHADLVNSTKLRLAFPEYWAEYGELVDLAAKREKEKQDA